MGFNASVGSWFDKLTTGQEVPMFVRSWMSSPVVTLPSTTRAIDALELMQAKKIRISTDVAIPPSGMMDSSMKPTGSDVEVAQLLSE